jgi:elongator complex protein 1
VAVIDGKTLKITPFRTANVPPPMALFELEVVSAIVDVSFSPNNEYMAVLHQKGAKLYQWQTNGPRSLRPTLRASTATDDASEVHPLAIAVQDSGNISVLAYTLQPELLHYKFDSSSSTFSLASRTTAGFVFGIASYSVSGDESTLITQDAHRRYRQVQDSGAEEFLISSVSVQLPWFTPVGLNKEQGKLDVYGLSRNGHLYANQRLLVKNCTSYLVTPDHLIFTTTNHLVKFIHRTDSVDGKFCVDPSECGC